jgi:predicted DNA-binding protein with PD1-like motif
MKLTTYNKLSQFCRKYNYRFGQVISCVGDISETNLFYIPDEELDEAILNWIKKTEEQITALNLLKSYRNGDQK